MAIPRSVHLAASLSWLAPLSVLVATIALSESTRAQHVPGTQFEVSGHVGVAFPLATFTSANGASSPTTIAEDFNVNFPFGFGVKPNWSPVVFDLELVPEVHPNVSSTTFLVHPGVVWPLLTDCRVELVNLSLPAHLLARPARENCSRAGDD